MSLTVNSIDCPCCFNGVIFHKTYGSEKDCDLCNGKGILSKSKARKLELLEPEKQTSSPCDDQEK